MRDFACSTAVALAYKPDTGLVTNVEVNCIGISVELWSHIGAPLFQRKNRPPEEQEADSHAKFVSVLEMEPHTRAD